VYDSKAYFLGKVSAVRQTEPSVVEQGFQKRNNKMKEKIAALSILFISLSAQAGENFYSNNFSPFPPGCVTYLTLADFYPGGTEIIIDGIVTLDTKQGNNAANVQITLTRKGCSEDNRSYLTIELTVLDDLNGVFEEAIVPRFFASFGGTEKPLRPTFEPNVWALNNSGDLLGEGRSRTYILDALTATGSITPNQYNSAFNLLLENYVGKNRFTVPVPNYQNELRPTFIPFNGRLSGNWVVKGGADQGFLITFSEFLENRTQGLIFFSWYTFDAEGNNVWLVGNKTYEIGDGSVTVDIELVTNGVFLGGKRADRIPAGSVQITARHCNFLELVYDLGLISLGQGTEALIRIFDLETAGYSCQDAQMKEQN